jgi:hypothetical protein
MITCFVPNGESFQYEDTVKTIVELDGTRTEKVALVKYVARQHNGRFVVDLPRAFFVTLLRGPQGLLWERENPEVLEWIGRGIIDYNGVIFPGERRPPPAAPIVREPILVRMIAPEDVTSYSHDGEQHDIGKDRVVTVSDDLAAILRSHGFKDAA